MKIKARPTKKKNRHFVNGVEEKIARQFQRLPQLDKYFRNRQMYGFGKATIQS